MFPWIRITCAGVLLLAAPGCGRDAPPSSAHASTPPAVAAPARVLSIDPAATEVVLALGAGDRLVGRTDFDTDPRLAHLPSLGRTLDPTPEAVAGLRPDLLIASGSPEHGSTAADAAARIGVRVHKMPIERVADVLASVRAVGRLLGLPARGDSLADDLAARLDGIRQRTAGRPRPSVLYVVWPDPLWTVGPGSFVDEIVSMAGGCNVFGDALAPWPQVSLEEALRRDPDVVVVARGRESAEAFTLKLRASAGWNQLTAVRQGRLYFVDSDLFHRPGPRMAVAADTLAKLLHPADTRAAAPSTTGTPCPTREASR
ncbi:cobalamin-binding protein [Longimicrobium sp.]|uniref:ABC transporter substrate-binding protein n=1 Tax=Longimicrobium sp. TaxID=2029185 RepID=UPI002E2F01CE|nr:cobalamin-binding protein [Longimicrobium sp.]HEX6040832.1 cobalamin-binding protein [Longimicrobium sp.]